MSAASTELRAAMIAAIEADAGCKATALGALPRVFNRAPPQGDPQSRFPYLVVRGPETPWDTDTDRGAEIDVHIHLLGEFEGDEEGEAILQALRVLFRDWAPRTFSAHRLVNLVCRFSDVRADEGGKRYTGLQRWRAVTEETA